MAEKTAYLLCHFAKNGWMDWFCSACGDKPIYNDDVHVSVDWKYCPYCGAKFIKPDSYKKAVKELLKEKY